MSKNRKTPKQKTKETIERMKVTRAIDSKHLREVIIQKQAWTINEIKRGNTQIQETRNTLYKLEGILAFINDMLEPEKK